VISLSAIPGSDFKFWLIEEPICELVKWVEAYESVEKRRPKPQSPEPKGRRVSGNGR
jgi:hypothetical protein